MKRIFFTVAFLLFSSGMITLQSQGVLDSLLLEREFKLDDYYEFRDNMTERTWIKLVTINNKSAEIISLDNQLINQHLEKELRKRKELRDSIEKLNLEIALLQKETEVQQVILNEKHFLNKTLLIVVGSVILLFFILLIIYIDRQSRYRAAKMELERLWTTHEDPESRVLRKDELTALREELYKTSDELEKLKMEYKEALKEKKVAESNLEKEVSTRREAEREIRELIDQIKKV